MSLLFAVGRWYNLRQALVREVSITASVEADRSTAALIFDDANLALENLSSLKAKQSIRQACTSKQGEWFAHYSTVKQDGRGLSPDDLPAGGYRFRGDSFIHAEPIVLGE